jgi:hypothetical protein
MHAGLWTLQSHSFFELGIGAPRNKELETLQTRREPGRCVGLTSLEVVPMACGALIDGIIRLIDHFVNSQNNPYFELQTVHTKQKRPPLGSLFCR